MTMSFTLNNKKLSTRWGQLFADCLTTPAEQAETTKDYEADASRDLHTFMRRTIAQNHANNA